MRLDLIQPFINSADAVFADALHCPTRVDDLSMEEQRYHRQGMAALVAISGEIEGRVIVDIEPETALRVARQLAGEELAASDDLVRETVCELANLVIGNAVTTLNDRGFQFKVHPPEFHASAEGLKGSEDTEALVLSFETATGRIYVNIAIRYKSRRKHDASRW
ncbi:MAG: chemotaxis protein CheX [Candidatus Korobacteraceae bacterium]|jgi:chemotaxis protein CheX